MFRVLLIEKRFEGHSWRSVCRVRCVSLLDSTKTALVSPPRPATHSGTLYDESTDEMTVAKR